jgi:hypothetical protein
MPIFWLRSPGHAARGRSATSSPLSRTCRSTRRLVAVRHRPDDVLRAESRVAAEEDVRQRRLHGRSSSLGSPHLSNSMPMSRSIQGKAFSWPTATSTSSHSKCCVGFAGRHQAAPALVVVFARTFSKVTPVSGRRRGEGLGHQVVEDRDAFVHRVFLLPGRGLHLLEAERTMTLTSSPPRRREERQQSIAVLPPPSTITRLPIESRGRKRRWPASRCRDECFAASLRPGMSRSRPRGAPNRRRSRRSLRRADSSAN